MIDLKDVEVYHSYSLAAPSALGNYNHVRVTHIPTGLRAEAHGDGYFKTRAEAMRLLEEELQEASRGDNAD